MQDVLLGFEEPTLPKPTFLLGYDTEDEKSVDGRSGDEADERVHCRPILAAMTVAITIKPEAISRKNHFALESTSHADGVWCIDEVGQGGSGRGGSVQGWTG